MSRIRKFGDNELTPEWADVRKVSEIARSTVVLVMERDTDKRTSWRSVPSVGHIARADIKIENVRHAHLCKKPFDKRDIEDALCHLAVALTLIDEAQVEP